MNVLIIEDETLAAKHLEALLMECDTSINVVKVLDSVKSSVNWLQQNEHPPLVFMDIHLGDNICFEIFNHIQVKSFIIFTTAYDKYALQAFKVNSVDYLLKPLNKQDVSNALDKYFGFAKNQVAETPLSDIKQLIDTIAHNKKEYKERFVVKVGAYIRPVKTDEIICFYSMEKATYLVTQSGKNYLIDYSLERLSDILDPNSFFRISRKYIVALNAIEDAVSLGPSRVKVKIPAFQQEDMLVSRDKIKSFKQWLEG